jgi:hypothetical protein
MNILFLPPTRFFPLFYGIAAAGLREVASAAASKEVTARAAGRKAVRLTSCALAYTDGKYVGNLVAQARRSYLD